MSETRSQIASRTAKGGINAENDVVEHFNNWRADAKAKQWLEEMDYDIETIKSIEAERIGGKSEKADVAVKITRTQRKKTIVTVENIQVKKVSNRSGSNQMERKQIAKYINPWHMPANVAHTLMLFTGELTPDRPNTIRNDRMYMEEFSDEERKQLEIFLTDNMVMIISDITRGRGRYAVEWMLIIQEYADNSGILQYDDMLLSINEAINYYVGDHSVSFTGRKDGTHQGIKIGRVTMQRKGGDGATDLQFKSDPSKLFKIRALNSKNQH